MRCFTACLGTWKHKEIKKNVQEQCLSPSYEAVKLLNATSESVKEDEVDNLVLEFEAKTQEQVNCSNENKADINHQNTETGIDKLSTNMNDTLVENENENVNVKGEEGKDDKDCVAKNSNESTLDDCCPVLEESSESLFSLSIDSRKQVYAVEIGDKEVSSIPLKPSIERENKSSFQYGDDDEDKENVVNLDLPKKTEIVGDTSLSSWLIDSEKSVQKGSRDGNSPESEKNYGERQILGAISPLAELNGSMPSCGGDEQPRIGTVGRYWLAGKVEMGSLGGGMLSVSTEV